MIPARIQVAADESGWKAGEPRQVGRLMWFNLQRADFTIRVRYDRWRHTKARAYRGNALTAIFVGQRAVVDYLTT